MSLPNLSPDQAAAELLARRRARGDLLEFTRYTFPTYDAGWFAREVASALMRFYAAIEAGEQPRLMIFAPPRSGKSELFSRRFPAWAFGQNPKINIIAASYSADLSSRMNRDVQRIMDDPRYEKLFTESALNTKRIATVSGQALRNSDIFEIVSHGGVYRSAGVGGGVTGMGADIAIIDDPIKDQAEASSQRVRDSVWEWFTSTLYTRLSPKSGILLGMTRWHEDDLAGRLLQQMESGGEKWEVIRFPAIAQQDEEHRKAGEALHPERFGLDRLHRIRQAVGDRVWEALYQQNPTARDGNVFKPEQLQIVDAIPAGIANTVRGWDFGATTDGDYTAGAKIGVLPDGRWIILDMVRMRGMPEEVAQALKNTADLDGVGVVQSIPQDPGQAGKDQARSRSRLLAGHSVEATPESGDKETRAEPFAAQVNIGNVMMLKGEWNRDLIDEMRGFPNAKHDDQIDALSRAFNRLNAGNTGLLDFYRAGNG